MSSSTPLTFALTVIAYVAATFGAQGTSHFAVNADHYAAIPIMRAEPVVVAMGEGVVAFIQYTLFGVMLGFIHRR